MSWEDTQLWRILLERGEAAKTAELTLRLHMPNIEAVLASGGTSPNNFTLHDDKHAFRVAERMTELIPDDVLDIASEAELALLLFSAYLHDIGMSPRYEVVRNHYSYILTAAEKLLDASEIDKLQDWLDREHSGLQPPIATDAPSPQQLRLAEELTAYYCRYRHNDLSEAWIKRNMHNSPSLYNGWSDDLVTLCKSHHEGLPELRSDRYNVRVVGSPPQVVNLRYLAAILRVADVLEFDPERTPQLILDHRDIPPGSRIFWHKDINITLSLDRGSHKMLYSARTPNARLHKAVLDTAEQVDAELDICSRLQLTDAFSQGVVFDSTRQYRWPWAPKLDRDIAEFGNTFVYIDGSFRPDTRRVLSLLAGTQLYGNPIIAVRELLQNAFDAVREQIAAERLEKADPNNPEWQDRLALLHMVRLNFSYSKDAVWLHCEDDGAGMTRSIIEKSMLISGSGIRPEVRALERNSRKHGFSTGRTGEFGIGVLSYFMIAEEMGLVTRRSAEFGGDPENTGWTFSTDGIAGFGELKKYDKTSKGSIVSLRLKSEFMGGDLDKCVRRILKYIRDVVRVVPCQFSVSNGSEILYSSGPGWIDQTLTHLHRCTPDLHQRPRDSDDGPIPKQEQQRRDQEEELWAELAEAARQRLTFHGPVSGDLPDGYGSYRLRLPYFRLPGGASLVFFNCADELVELLPDGQPGAKAGSVYLEAWRGFGVFPRREYLGRHRNWIPNFEVGLFIEVDWQDGATIDVNRNELSFSSGVENARYTLFEESRRLIQSFLREHNSSAFSTINRALALNTLGSDVSVPERWTWLFPAPNSGKFKVRQINYPAAEVSEMIAAPGEVFAHYMGKPTDVIWDLRVQRYGDYIRPFVAVPLDRVVQTSRSAQPVALWRTPPTGSRGQLRDGLCELPPDMQEFCAMRTRTRLALNKDHPVVSIIDDEAYMAVAELGSTPWEGNATNIIARNAGAAAWAIFHIERRTEFWNGVRDHYPEFWSQLWSALCSVLPEEKPELRAYIPSLYGRSDVVVVKREGAKRLVHDSSRRQVEPTGEWGLDLRRRET